MNYKKAIPWCLLFVALIALAAVPVCSASPQKNEESMGRQYAADVEREAKVVTDPEVADRVKRIGEELAKVANTCVVPASYGSSEIYPFKYEFKVVEDKDVNAFSLPGGHIYVNTGLIELVESDDELAGVLAHEIAHAAHHHLTHLIKKSSSVDRYVALIALAGILGNVRTRDLNNLLLGAQMMKVGKVSSYTQEAENDADRTAVAYMAKTRYNPEGMLTFMKKLEAKRDEAPTVPLGIFQTHPAPHKRVAAITKTMREIGLSPDLRRIQDVAFAKTMPVEGHPDQYKVVLSNRVMFVPAGMGGGPCSKERAEVIAERVNNVIESGLRPCDITSDGSGACLVAKGTELLRVEKEDLTTNPKSKAALIGEARSALEYAIWADWLCNDCNSADESSSD